MRADRAFALAIQQFISLMAMAIYGEHYTAVSNDLTQWVIVRGRFEMGRFTGSPEEVRQEIKQWDQTVTSTGVNTHESEETEEDKRDSRQYQVRRRGIGEPQG